MPKRTSMKGMGADAFFAPTVKPDENEDRQEVQPASVPVNQQDSQPVEQQASEQKPIKATFYLYPEDITTLEEVKLKLLKEQRKRVDKSELIRRAIKLLSDHYTSEPS